MVGVRDLFFGLGFAVLLATALTLARPYAVPIAVAVLIWFVITASADALARRAPWLPHGAATGLCVAALFLVIIAASRIVAGSIAALTDGLSGVDDRLIATARATLESLGLAERVQLRDLVSGVRFEALLTDAVNLARGLAGNVALIFLYVMFLLIDARFYDAKLRALAPDPQRRAWLRATLRRIAEETRAYLYLMTLISLGVAVATALVLWSFGVPGAAFWGFLAFMLNFIPTIGSILAVAVPGVFALLHLGDAGQILLLAGLLAGVQFTAGEIVLPRVMGDRLNLSGFAILLLLVVWGAMWGPAGMFLAIPITVIAMIVLAQFPGTRPIAVALSRTGRLPDPPPPEPHD